MMATQKPAGQGHMEGMQMNDHEALSLFFNHLCPYIRRAWDGAVYDGWQLKERVIFDYELIYIMSGGAVITVGERAYEAQRGDLFFLKPLIPHSITPTPVEPFRQPHIHFDMFYQDNSEEVYVSFWNREELGSDIRLARDDEYWLSALEIPDKLTVEDPAFVEQLMMKIIDRAESPEPVDALFNKAYLLELLAYLFGGLLKKRGQEHLEQDNMAQIEQNLEKARQYILEHVNQNISIEAAAREAGFSKGYFSKVFKARYNQSPATMHARLRMEHAKQMLMYSSMTVTAVARELGFDSIHTFSRAFKEMYQLSPKAYRQRHALAADEAQEEDGHV